MTFNELKEHMFSLYGRRNRFFLPSLNERIGFLAIAVGDLQDAIRKAEQQKMIEIALARCVSRIFCIAEHFLGLPLNEVMCRKYPAGKCSYCQQSPCACPENRPHYVLSAEPVPEQLEWRLGDWCRHLGSLYNEKNQALGIHNVIARLFKEVCEVLSLEADLRVKEWPLDKIELEFALELADCLSWTIATSNFLQIDLEKAVLDRFGSGCWNCKQNPCSCGQFNKVPVNWKLFTES